MTIVEADRLEAEEIDELLREALSGGPDGDIGPLLPPELEEPAEVGEGKPRQPQDWELLVTDGHVRGHRVLNLGKKLFFPALASGIAAVYLAFTAVTGGFVSYGETLVPDFVVSALTADPETYTEVPGSDKRTDVQLLWIEDLSPQQGMSSAEWSELLRAAMADIGRHGEDTAKYEAIPSLARQPLVTRPAKVFTEHSGKLANGVISLPPKDAREPKQVVAWVDGQLAWAAFDGRSCGVFFGPGTRECSSTRVNVAIQNTLKPQEAR